MSLTRKKSKMSKLMANNAPSPKDTPDQGADSDDGHGQKRASSTPKVGGHGTFVCKSIWTVPAQHHLDLVLSARHDTESIPRFTSCRCIAITISHRCTICPRCSARRQNPATRRRASSLGNIGARSRRLEATKAMTMHQTWPCLDNDPFIAL